jgi:hypothetical protein
LKDAPAWQFGVCCGVLFGVLFGLGLRYLMDETWTAALVSAALGAPFFGLSMALVRRRERQLMGGFRAMNLTARQQRAAQRASWRGPVPDDPAVRAAAAEFARVQLRRLGARWFRVLAAGLFVVEMLSLVLNVLDGDVLDGDRWTRIVVPAAGAVLFGSFLLWPRRLHQRLKALSSDVPETDLPRGSSGASD